MSLEKGTEGESQNNNNANINDTLLEIVKKLQNEVALLKQERSQTTSGIQPDELVTLFAKYSQESKKAADKDYRSGIQVEDIPKEDYDEKGVVFCAPFTGYVICDDRRQGHMILLPYNKEFLFFKYQGTRFFTQGKYQEKASFATYTSHSFKEQQWLREHTFFNTMFYESAKDALSFNIVRAQKLARIITMLSKFELHSIIQRCKEYEVPISQDMNTMKTHLAVKMADRELESERTSKHQRLMEIEKEKKELMANQE